MSVTQRWEAEDCVARKLNTVNHRDDGLMYRQACPDCLGTDFSITVFRFKSTKRQCISLQCKKCNKVVL